MRKGKLIVIEGSDGSGKTTQLELLKEYCAAQKIPFKSLKFPQYKHNFFGRTIARFLRGEIGKLSTINPYLISMVYAMDRVEARDRMYTWLNGGKTILLDRYATSNMAHQTGRLPKRDRSKFLRWLDELEYKINHVPREDIVIYLHVPYELSMQLMGNSDRGMRAYAAGRQKDIVEQNSDYLKKAEEVYNYLADLNNHWIKIECVKDGKLRSRESIHEEVVRELETRGLL